MELIMYEPAYQYKICNAESSGLICILLDWDDERKSLVDSMIKSGLPVVVFVIVETEETPALEAGPLQGHPERLIVLPADQVQAVLSRTEDFSLAKE